MDPRPLLFTLLLLPAAAAVPITVVTDGQDDTSLGAAAAAVDRWGPVDLLRLDMDETGQAFRFTLAVAPSEDPSRTITDEVLYQIWFRHGSVVYRVEISEGIAVSGAAWAGGTLYRHDDPTSRGSFVRGLEVHYDEPEGRFTVDVPRSVILDRNDVEPFRGASLSDVFVESRLYWSLSTGASAEDRMPDAAYGSAPVRLGTEQTGHLRLSTEGRIRGSNGAATTYLWTVNLTNQAEYADTVTLSLSSPPPSWEVRLPYPKAKVPANSSVQVPILATVPFQHQHGAIEAFVLEARSITDTDAVGRIDLGVEFLSPAQPAGHHERLFIHGVGSDALTIYVGGNGIDYIDTRAIMDTRPDEGDRDQSGIRGVIDDCTTLQPRFGWISELTPQLRLGLDFDMDGEGTFEGRFTTPLPLDGARLDGRILVADQYGASRYARNYDAAGGTRTVATITGDQERDLGQGSTTAMTATITATAEGDLVPFDPDQSLLMVLWLSGSGTPSCIGWQDHPIMEAGASMRLPLLEYHDPIDASFAAPDFITLTSQGPVARGVPAGGTALWNLTLRNDGTDPRAFELSVAGKNTEWVRLPGGDLFLAPANGSIDIPIAISPPSGQRQGDQADIIVEAVNVKDPRMRGLLRIVGTVAGSAGDAGVQDDTLIVEAIESTSEGSPAPLAVLPLGLALLLRRRQ